MQGQKIKLLWIGDSPAVTTGFGRVSQAILENLQATGKYQISVLGINHPMGTPHRYEGMFRIYPARANGNVYGFNRVQEIIGAERPDVILINNDLWITRDYVRQIPAGNKIICYCPVDALPVEPEWLEPIIKTNTRITTYTEFARSGIIQSGAEVGDVDIIGHGVDTDMFYPMKDARKFMANIPEETFVIQNVNRNQPRKRLDLWMKACQLWLSSIPQADRGNICIYYHGTIRDVGWNLVTLAKRYGIDDRFLITDQTNLNPSHGVSMSTLNKIYNVADVHVLTSMGEGFGLSPFESAACGVAQVLPDHSACKELWEGVAPLIKIKDWEVLSGGINTEGGVIDIEHLASIMNDLYKNRDKTKEYGNLAYKYVQQEKFTWKYVADRFDSIIEDQLTNGKPSVQWEEPKQVEEKNDGVPQH